MFEGLAELRSELKKMVASIEPEVLASDHATELVEAFTEVERLGAAGKALAARKVAASGAWRASGERSAAHWMASRTGISVGQAANTLETAAKLAEPPATDKAVRDGCFLRRRRIRSQLLRPLLQTRKVNCSGPRLPIRSRG